MEEEASAPTLGGGMELDRHPLAHLRRRHHWSMDDLARLLRAQARQHGLRSGIDRNRIWRWETQRITPSPESQTLLACLLDVPPVTVEALGWPDWLPALEQPAPFSPSGSRAALREVQVTRMDRRSFLVLSSSTLVDLAAEWARIEPRHLHQALGGQSVDGELLEWLEQRSGELRALSAGPHSQVSGLIDAHLHTAIDLIAQDRYTSAARRRLHAVAADLAHCAAWLRFDADRHADAQRHWQAAVHAAHQAGDRDLAAVALSDLAYQATWLSRPADAVRVLEHARSRTRTPAARSLLDVRRARACAVLHDRPGTRRALASAETELERMRPQETPPVISWMSIADVNADAGPRLRGRPLRRPRLRARPPPGRPDRTADRRAARVRPGTPRRLTRATSRPPQCRQTTVHRR
ncbi:helix-turn-helix transcriptional regulator [Streptomyces sp. NPDC005408]|uniref:helix-turn-helix transcriptional regulator n=1 Tax=Streptomyces sp. NPDC005408 TaxID=3155341 RepID=UPI0033AAA081